jgi:hypothetical protein
MCRIGGCFAEGINVERAPNWITSIEPLEQRPGTFSVLGYWRTGITACDRQCYFTDGPRVTMINDG